MRPFSLRKATFALVFCTAFLSINVLSFAIQRERKGSEQKRPSETQQQSDVIKLETTLITVPVVASDRSDKYIPDLQQNEFSLFEDGTRQEIVFFAATNEPFHVVLMLDTSASTKEKLSSIQRAAKAFVTQLQPGDRTKIISFDETVRDLCEFTTDRGALEKAIAETAPGEGTKLYDAVNLALDQLSRVKGRKAIVLFTDGVDYRSDSGTYDQNIAIIEESGVIVYPIRFETRADTEALIRRQQDQYGTAADVGLILGGPPIGSTPPTMPGGSGPSIPRPKPGSANDPYKLPIPDVILRPQGRYPGDNRYPNEGRYPDENRYPDSRTPGRLPNDRYPQGGRAEERFPDDSSTRRRPSDNVGIMLDGLYSTGDKYLAAISTASGGRLYRADTLSALPSAFSQIAAELRQQYSLGYYSTNGSKDGKFRKIQIKLSRKDVVVRARPGYRAPKD